MTQLTDSAAPAPIGAPRLAVFDPEGPQTVATAAPAPPKRERKPKTPRDLPLWCRKDGRWCRKIKGQVHYFGTELEAALTEWARVKDDLLAGRTPRAKADALLLGELCERFLNAKRALVESSELSPRTFGQYHAACRRLVAQFGKLRRVDDLASEDFEALRATVAKTCGPVGIANAIRLTRIVFKYGWDAGVIDVPVRFGPLFRVRPEIISKHDAGKPERMFEAAQIRKLLSAADEEMKAMILLGINCGFGQSDLSELPQSALDLKNGWISFPRPKTGVRRRAALWPETVAAIRKALKLRRDPKDAADADCVFLTPHGNRLVRCTLNYGHRDFVGSAFGRLLAELKLKRPGLQFYALRHTFRTVADETRDFPALDKIMGHRNHTMGDRYNQRIDDARLKAVADHVRAWVFAGKRKKR